MSSPAQAPSSVQCRCGYAVPVHPQSSMFPLFGTDAGKRTRCDQAALHNHWNFPAFQDLPDENDLDEDYFMSADGGSFWQPSREWCFAAEIVDVWHFVRFRVKTQSRFGETVLINFHLEDAPKPVFFEWSCLRPGSTICILGPSARTFMDGGRGIRQESARTVMVFPAGLEALTQEVDAILSSHDTQNVVCTVCNASLASPRRCARCHLVRYCSKECQQSHWRAGHNKLCAHSQMLSGLATLNFSQYYPSLDWSFALECTSEPSAFAPPRVLGELNHLLQQVGDKVIGRDAITCKMMEATFASKILFNEKSPLTSVVSTVAKTLLYAGLQEICEMQSRDASVRSHAVDALDLDVLDFERHNTRFNIVALSLPLWQHMLGIKGLAWAFEAHNVMDYEKCYEQVEWQTTFGRDGLMAIHRRSGVTACWTDDTCAVAAVAQELAMSDLTRCIVRVLRAVPNRTELVREILDRPTPPNVLTLWIREEPPLCGRFRRAPTNLQLPLREKVTDCAEHDAVLDLVRSLSGRAFGDAFQHQTTAPAYPGGSAQLQNSATDGPSALCCSQCGREVDRRLFSKTQLRRPLHARKCKRCIGQ